jgi:moderate conductance mechanosensitive channel
MSSWVEYRLNPNYGTVPTPREKTLLALFRNGVTVALVIFITMLALAQIGINIAPLLAGAGVLGLAIGFGAQKFVQDIITGVFIQLENIMNEGDVVTAGGQTGVVENLTIRSVSLRSLDGTLHLIPFSSVDAVSNWMTGFSFHVADIGVTYDSDIGEVKAAMHEAFDKLMETDAKTSILEPLEMHGVTELGEYDVHVRARIKTLPGMQWGIGRAYNEFIKEVFDRRGIEIPFPQVTYHLGVDGQADALTSKKARKKRKRAQEKITAPTVQNPEGETSEDESKA